MGKIIVGMGVRLIPDGVPVGVDEANSAGVFSSDAVDVNSISSEGIVSLPTS